MSKISTAAHESYESLEAWRGIAAISVLLFHTNAILALPKYMGLEVFPIFGIGDAGVYIFFVLSGLVITLSTRRLPRPRSAKGFLQRRAKRIYLPLWAALVLSIALMQVHAGPSLDAFPSMQGLVASVLAIPYPTEPILPVEWTLRHEVLFYLIFSVFVWRPNMGIAILISWLLACFMGAGELTFPLSMIASPINTLFGWGILTALAVGYSPRSVPAAPLYISAIVVGVMGLAGTAYIDISIDLKRDELGLVTLYGLFTSLTLWAGCKLERRFEIQIPSAMKFLGRASYSIYLVHLLVLSAGAKVAAFGAGIVILPGWFWFIVISFAGIVGGAVFHLAVERPLLGIKWQKSPLKDDDHRTK